MFAATRSALRPHKQGSEVQGSRVQFLIHPQITPLAPLPAHRAYRPVGRNLRLGEQINADFFILIYLVYVYPCVSVANRKICGCLCISVCVRGQ